MIIKVTRNGGYAGISEEIVSLDTAILNKQLIKEIETLLSKINFFNLPASVQSSDEGADFFWYNIMVVDKGKTQQVKFVDNQSDESKQYMEFVNDLVRLNAS